MTQQVDAWFAERYNSRVTHAYQPQGFLLQGMFMPEGRIEGKKAYWPIYGRTVANEKVRGVDAPVANPDASQISADLKTWEHLAAVHDFDGIRMAPNEEAALVEAAGSALGRIVDSHALTFMYAAAPTSGAGFFDSSAGQVNAMQVSLMLAQWMGPNNVPADGQIFGAISMLCHQALMGDSAYANSQWVGGDLPFKQMGRTQGRSWNFVNWVILPDEYFSIPSANKMDMLVWHRPSVGWSTNKKLSTEWGRWIKSGSWLVRHESEGTGLVLRNEGLARLRIKTDLATIAKS